MFCLVTGGAGFIGSHSVDRLLADGARVRVLDDFSSGRRENLPAAHPRLDIRVGDMRDAATLAEALAGGITHVLHLAAQVSVAVSCEEPLASASRNVTGFLSVLDGARRAGVARVVHASSAAVYGVPEALPLTEAARVSPLSPYGLEKSIDDQYAALYRELYGVSTLGMRYFNVYGPRQDPRSPYSGVISVFADRLRRGEPLTVNGDGGQTRDFIYVGDVARANVAALGAAVEGVCNVATGRSVTLVELAEALGVAAGRKPELRFGPPRAGDIRYSAADPVKMREELGIRDMCSLPEGLHRLLESLA